MRWAIFLSGALSIFSACASEDPVEPADAGPGRDVTISDAAFRDAAPDAQLEDAAAPDALTYPDAAIPDSGADAGMETRVWLEAERVELADSEIARGPSVGYFADKEALAVWYQLDFDTGSNTDIWGNLRGAAWGRAEVVDGLLGPPDGAPILAIDPAGFAISAWTQFVSANTFAYANIYAQSAGEFTPTLPIYGTYQGAARPKVAIDETGRARIAFEDSTGNNIWFAERQTTMWTEASLAEIEDLPVTELALTMTTLAWVRGGTDLVERTGVQVAMIDTAEDIPAVRASGDDLLYLARTAAADTLKARPQLTVATDTAGAIDAASLLFATGTRGDAVAVWSRGDELRAAVRAAGELFQPPTVILAEAATPRALAIDPQGHALLLYTLADDTVWALRYFGGVWGTPEQLSAPGMIGIEPQLAIAPDGDAIAIWSERDPLLLIASIHSRRYE